MADFKLESWEREPLWLKLITPYLKKKRFPYLEGEPTTGKWYRIKAPGCLAANGDPVYADFRKGKENKLLIFFQGGGVSWNEYTAARPASLYQKNTKEAYYMIQVDLFSDLSVGKGILEDHPRNPFRDWSMLVMPYSTGDFHCGAGDFPYTAQDGSMRVCHHHGYNNFHTVLDKVIPMLPKPEALLVSGCSGGGFGAALLTDSILARYPECENVTCLVDSGFFPLHDWHSVAKNVWHAPEEISKRIHTDNITLDALQALEKDHGDRVKILLAVSKKDSALARMMNLTVNGKFEFSKESGEQLKSWMDGMMDEVQETIPGAGMYFFDVPDKSQKGMDLTIHCIITEPVVYENRTDGVTCIQWITDAVNGKVRTYGRELLK